MKHHLSPHGSKRQQVPPLPVEIITFVKLGSESSHIPHILVPVSRGATNVSEVPGS